jgi:3-hydroxybutyryl-CoA dehydrogenase
MVELSGSKNKIEKVGVIGEGKMGSGIFSYLLPYHFELFWVCSSGADIDKITRQLQKKIIRSLDAGIIDRVQFERHRQISISHDKSVLKNCDLIIEAIPEIADLKRNLFSDLDNIVKSGAIFTSNSSSINPSEIAPEGPRAGKFTGMHFFYPVPVKNIVELTATKETTATTLQAVGSFLNDIQRRFITLDEKNSFILNRIFLDFQNEAFLIVKGGNCSYLQMDQLVKTYFFPFGVFDFCDNVGLDTILSSIRNYIRRHPFPDYYSPFTETLSHFTSQGLLGVKTLRGFYEYPITETVVEEPDNTPDIVSHLRQTWLASIRRYSSQSHLPIDDMNHAIKEYFDVSKGPFE